MKRAALALALLAVGCGPVAPSGDAEAAKASLRADAAHAMRICERALAGRESPHTAKMPRTDRDFSLDGCAIGELEIHRQYLAEGRDVWEDTDDGR